MSSDAVQGTNDSSIVSKCSMAAQGYFQDDFLKLFVSSSKSRRAPLINRGYYIRARIIDDVLKAFLAQFKHTDKQIISLGAGFDSAFFRLQASGQLDNTIFIEVDFPQVVERKTALIEASDVLQKCLGDKWQPAPRCESHQGVWVKSENYHLLGADLSDLDTLHQVLMQCQVDKDVPTLLLSECVITYMEVVSSNNLIHWVLKTFPNSIFVSYEQIQPDDAFGIVMQHHFKKLNSPIKAIQTYSSLEAHCQRYTSMGWSECNAVNMNQYYFGALSAKERARIEALELFDEYEEWHLKCGHYMVVCASSGLCKNSLADLFEFHGPSRAENLRTQTSIPCHNIVQLKPSCKTSSPLIKCFAHASTRASSDTVLLCGGFGETSEGRHARLNDIRLLNLTDETLTTVSPQQGCNVLDARIHHTVTAISNAQFIIFGGRTSPAKPCSSTQILTVKNQDSMHYYQCNTVFSSGSVPTPRWRHSAVLDTTNGRERLLVYGGCTTGGKVLGDFWVMETQSGMWQKIEVIGDTPESRHSHTMSCWQEHTFIIAGGLGDDLQPLNSLYTIQVNSWECKCFHLTPSLILPRYSHTAHISGDNLILLGGVNPLSSIPPPLVIINLMEATWTQYPMPVADPEHPVMLHNHSSELISGNKILILGGGGNCFSFGTHLNSSPVEMTVDLPS